jgi:hypothetical protein
LTSIPQTPDLLPKDKHAAPNAIGVIQSDLAVEVSLRWIFWTWIKRKKPLTAL